MMQRLVKQFKLGKVSEQDVNKLSYTCRLIVRFGPDKFLLSIYKQKDNKLSINNDRLLLDDGSEKFHLSQSEATCSNIMIRNMSWKMIQTCSETSLSTYIFDLGQLINYIYTN